MMTASRDVPLSFSATVLRRPTFGGLVGALVFFWFSLGPSLLPRWWVMQAVIAGLTSAVGYLIGT
ncbi:MAG: alpha/beta-hydrolase N-terminal domain-containing protein, partial [Acidimicrobiia bacterium]